MKSLNVKLEKWNSKYFPIMAKFTLNGNKYSLVFETIQETQKYFNCRFYPRKVNYIGMRDIEQWQ